MTRIAFLGLGAMGAAMARGLVDAGHEVTVWNRTRERAAPFARVAESPAEVARGADVAITMLTDGAAVASVADELYRGLAPGSLHVEMSTIGPEAVHALAARLPAGVELVDAPVLGSVGEAESGTLRIFVGGADEAAARALPVLAALGEPVHVGGSGSGAAAKLVANSTLLGVLAVLAEAMALGERQGLAQETVFDVLAATPLAAQAERRRPALEDATYPPRFTLALARKDAELVAAAAGDDARVAAAVRELFAAAERAGWGDRDYTALLAHVLGRPRP